ncbi:MAG: hypothetical protein F4142_01080 [Nitrospira sp. SB0675_bin_23]|nr:hypothetical protein [Nitrospira sp. SB0675_bin_23]
MSGDEQDKICGQVIRQHQETKKTLACTKEKAQQLGVMIKRVSDALLRERSQGPCVKVVIVDGKISLHGDHTVFDEDVAWPSKDELIQLFQDEQQLQKTVIELEDRLRELGYGEYAK